MTTAASPDLTTARTGLRQWFATLAGLELAAVQWEDEPRSMVVGVCGLISPIADRALGMGERQHEYEPAADEGEELVRAVGGPRVASFSLKLDGYDQRLPEGVFFRMSSVAELMRGEDSVAALRGLGFALVDVTGPTNVPRVEGGRVYPRAVLDVFLGYTRVERETPTTWVEEVRVTSRMADVDGVELPAPPNATVSIEAP